MLRHVFMYSRLDQFPGACYGPETCLVDQPVTVLHVEVLHTHVTIRYSQHSNCFTPDSFSPLNTAKNDCGVLDIISSICRSIISASVIDVFFMAGK